MAIHSYITAKHFNEEKLLMKKFTIISFLTVLMVIGIIGCAQPVAPGDTTAPTVISVIPENASTAVPINGYITATFSEAMKPATIDTTTFTVVGSTAAAGAVVLNPAGTTAIFTPSANLALTTLSIPPRSPLEPKTRLGMPLLLPMYGPSRPARWKRPARLP